MGMDYPTYNLVFILISSLTFIKMLIIISQQFIVSYYAPSHPYNTKIQVWKIILNTTYFLPKCTAQSRRIFNITYASFSYANNLNYACT